jgi:hypothetical protein
VPTDSFNKLAELLLAFRPSLAGWELALFMKRRIPTLRNIEVKKLFGVISVKLIRFIYVEFRLGDFESSGLSIVLNH